MSETSIFIFDAFTTSIGCSGHSRSSFTPADNLYIHVKNSHRYIFLLSFNGDALKHPFYKGALIHHIKNVAVRSSEGCFRRTPAESIDESCMLEAYDEFVSEIHHQLLIYIPAKPLR